MWIINRDFESSLWVMFGALAVSLLASGQELTSLSFLLTLWILLEGTRGRRSWADLGFRLDSVWLELKKNAFLISLMGAILQVGSWLVGRVFYSPFEKQILERIDIIQTWTPTPILFLSFILLETFFEEVACRGFIQGRLAPYLGTPLAISIGASIFALGHWKVYTNVFASGLDVIFFLFNGMLYGWIYARSRNLFVTWLAHLFVVIISLILYWCYG